MSLFKKISTIFNIEPGTGRREKKPLLQPKEIEKTKQQGESSFTREAQTQAREIILEAKDEAVRIKQQTEEQIRLKLESLERKLGALEERERQFFLKEEDIRTRLNEIDNIKKQQLDKLERAAHLTIEDAKKMILSAVEEKLKEEIAKKIKEAENQARESADEQAKQILVDAMRHGATNYVAEYTVSAVKIPDEEVKGRIIGKEGRNIRTFEQVTGVEVDLDEEGVIRISSFDPIRREVARKALEKLIADGRIQPARIEDLVEQTRQNIQKIIFSEGEKLAHAVGVYNLPAEAVALLGKFKYRFSYGQNMIVHTLEETKIGVALAHETGADVNIVKLGCLLHDIGKVITEEEGTHVQLGVEFLKKHGIPQKVIDCVAQHHEDTPFSSVESILIYIADAISGSRPGARYEDMGEYVKRLGALEEIAKSREGVKTAFAFQAGRELRVIIDPGKLDDSATVILAQKIKEEIEEKLTYPGQIKVTAIREFRATETAK